MNGEETPLTCRRSLEDVSDGEESEADDIREPKCQLSGRR